MQRDAELNRSEVNGTGGGRIGRGKHRETREPTHVHAPDIVRAPLRIVPEGLGRAAKPQDGTRPEP